MNRGCWGIGGCRVWTSLYYLRGIGFWSFPGYGYSRCEVGLDVLS